MRRLLLALFGCALALPAGAQQKITLSIATGPTGGVYYPMGGGMANVLTKYVPRFQSVLPPRKVARFYQVENKLRALLSYDLARDIPLLK